MDDQLSDADLMDLNRLVTELAWRVDHRRADAVADLFVDDGEMVLGSAAMRGREEVGAWGRQRASAGYATRHVCTNMRFEASGDGSATGTTVVTVYPPERGRPGRHHGVRSGGVTGPVRAHAGRLALPVTPDGAVVHHVAVMSAQTADLYAPTPCCRSTTRLSSGTFAGGRDRAAPAGRSRW
jgi:hypothetical protein